MVKSKKKLSLLTPRGQCRGRRKKKKGKLGSLHVEHRGMTSAAHEALSPPGSPPSLASVEEAPPSPEESNHRGETELVANGSAAEDEKLTNESPLTGARKRKAARVHKLESTEKEPPGSLTCPACHEVLHAQKDFTRHIRTHNHVLEAENGVKIYECGVCKKQLSSNSSLDRHVLVHSGERPFACHICGTLFTTNGNMHRHIRGHYRNAGSDSSDEGIPMPRKRPYSEDGEAGGKVPRLCDSEDEEDLEVTSSCLHCNLSFKSFQDLQVHNRIHHLTSQSGDFTNSKLIPSTDSGLKEGSHFCSLCHLSFPSAQSWFLHIQRHADEREEGNETKKDFMALLDLQNRSISSSSPVQNDSPLTSALQIPFVRHSYSTIAPETQTDKNVSQESFQKGPISHDEEFARAYRDMKQNSEYPCRLCSEKFANLRKLKSHVAVHMLSPPYRCNLCSFCCNDKNTVKEHMKSHRGDTPYECNLCTLAFTTKANCERHIKNIHGRQNREEVKQCMTYTPQDETPPVGESTINTLCHLCNIDCKSRSVLRDHMRSSHPEGIYKPFLCRICQATFPSHNDAIRHVIQNHSDAASSGTMNNLVEKRLPRDEVQDLSSIESLLSFSKIPLHFSGGSMKQATNTTCEHGVPSPVSPAASEHTTTSVLSKSPFTIKDEQEDAPLDLTMNKQKDEESSSAEDQELPEDLSQPKDKEPLIYKPMSPVLKIPKPPFPIMYPGHFAMPFYRFHQYPFFGNSFGGLSPVGNLDSILFDEYQKKIKNSLCILPPGRSENFFPNGSSILQSQQHSSVNLSALALAAAHQDQLKIPKPEFHFLQGSQDNTLTSLTPLSKKADDDSLHFTIRNSVLVKKPKQRRYRTERPWRCHLCDKGFTLRSNMERHMKQQHPDQWQQRPRPISGGPLLDTNKIIEECETTVSESEDKSLQEALVIDDEEEEEDIDVEDDDDDKDDKIQDSADLASIRKLLTTAAASANSFPFLGVDTEEDQSGESSSNQSDEGRKSAYSSAPQKQKCPYCQRKFPWSSSLVRHIRTHTGQKPYRCPVCRFPFTTKSNCDRHLVRKHPDSPHTLVSDRPFKCHRCPSGATFINMESLKKHEMFKHERASIEYLESIFRCHICEVRLPNRDIAIEHLSTSHSEHFLSLSSISEESLESENNNFNCSSIVTAEESSFKNSPFQMRCIVCLKICWTITELKSHVANVHQTCTLKETDRPHSEDKSDIISSLLGTKPAVIDHLLASKSTADAAKLLGVR